MTDIRQWMNTLRQEQGYQPNIMVVSQGTYERYEWALRRFDAFKGYRFHLTRFGPAIDRAISRYKLWRLRLRYRQLD